MSAVSQEIEVVEDPEAALESIRNNYTAEKTILWVASKMRVYLSTGWCVRIGFCKFPGLDGEIYVEAGSREELINLVKGPLLNAMVDHAKSLDGSEERLQLAEESVVQAVLDFVWVHRDQAKSSVESAGSSSYRGSGCECQPQPAGRG